VISHFAEVHILTMTEMTSLITPLPTGKANVLIPPDYPMGKHGSGFLVKAG
jgi:hypothetical protein